MLSPEVPAGFSGYCEADNFMLVPQSTIVAEQWIQGEPIRLDVPGCEGHLYWADTWSRNNQD
jgi:hypothetical protein